MLIVIEPGKATGSVISPLFGCSDVWMDVCNEFSETRHEVQPRPELQRIISSQNFDTAFQQLQNVLAQIQNPSLSSTSTTCQVLYNINDATIRIEYTPIHEPSSQTQVQPHSRTFRLQEAFYHLWHTFLPIDLDRLYITERVTDFRGYMEASMKERKIEEPIDLLTQFL